MQNLAGEMAAISSMKAAGEIDSPTAKTLRASATAAALGTASNAVVAAPAVGGSADLGIFVRVREDVRELVPRTSKSVPRGSTCVDVAVAVVTGHHGAEEWNRVKAFPATALAFMSADEPPTRAINVPMGGVLDAAVDASHRFIRITFSKPRANADSTPRASMETVSISAPSDCCRRFSHYSRVCCAAPPRQELMQASSAKSIPPKYVATTKQLQFPEALFNGLVDDLIASKLAVRVDEVESLRIILLRLRDALQCLCGREKDFGTLPVRFKHYCGAARYHSKPSGRLDMNRVEDLASQLDTSRAVAAFALTKRWAGYMADVNEIVALMTVKAKKMRDDSRRVSAQHESGDVKNLQLQNPALSRPVISRITGAQALLGAALYGAIRFVRFSVFGPTT